MGLLRQYKFNTIVNHERTESKANRNRKNENKAKSGEIKMAEEENIILATSGTQLAESSSLYAATMTT